MASPESDSFVHESSYVDEGASIGAGTRIWHFCHLLSGATLGRNCNLGQNVCISGGVVIGDNVKIQNNVSVYAGTRIEDDVFLGPSCVLTNVSNPRSQIVRREVYEPTLIQKGASIGANATIVCGVTVGRYALVGAGALVTRDVPDYGLVMGVPARRTGWVSRHGHRLRAPDASGVYTCPESGLRYSEEPSGRFRCLDLDENDPLPDAMATGKRRYREFR
jgi:UDP-2-acetamido-3-amino-2,3-dideoxy-glucuronate N-acetyltransferase